MKAIIKGITIFLQFHEEELLEMNFDPLIPFLLKLQENEIFCNEKYKKIKGNMLHIDFAKKEYEFIENMSELMRRICLPKLLLDRLDNEFSLYK